MTITSDLNDIKPRGTQVWNCGEIGFDINVRWNKVICTYTFFQGKRMWKVHIGDWAPFQCKLLVFTQADKQWFITPMIVHQSNDYSEDIHFNISLEWTVYHRLVSNNTVHKGTSKRHKTDEKSTDLAVHVSPSIFEKQN